MTEMLQTTFSKCIFSNLSFFILSKISLKFVPMCPIELYVKYNIHA